VQLVGADSDVARQRFTGFSDSLGRFAFAAVPAGHYLLGFYHAALDTLGIEPRGRLVDVRDSNLDVVVAGPSTQTMVRTFCGDGAVVDHATLLLGHVHDAGTEAAVVNASIVVTWSAARIANRTVGVEDRTATATARDDGWFALCGLPSETELEVRTRHAASGGIDSSAAVPLRLPGNSVRHLSLYMSRAHASPTSVSHIRLTGRIADTSGRPVVGAQVWLAGTERRATTNAAGRYDLDSLPAGSQSLEVRAIGYSPRTIAVTLLAGSTPPSDVTMERAVVLPSVVTLGATSSKNLANFEAHKRSSAGGFFVKPLRLEGYPAMQTLHVLVAGLPGVTVTQRKGAWVAIIGNGCTPQLFLNGTYVPLTFDDLEMTIDPEDLLGVEVYTRGIEIPSIYPVPINRPCGLISVWTRARGEERRPTSM
jgi:Carboxypeptidase regulatory-like domain